MDIETMKGYNKREQFEEHIVLLDDLLKYPGNKSNRKSMAKLRKEKEDLERLFELFIKNNSKNITSRDVQRAYKEDKSRGDGGGASESDANARTGLKQLMKDNRSVSTKGTIESRSKYKEELDQWEEKNGQLPKLSRRV